MPNAIPAVPADPLKAQPFRTQRAELPEDQQSHGSSLNPTISGNILKRDNPEAIPKLFNISKVLGESVESIRRAVQNELMMYSELQGNLENYVEIHGRLIPRELLAYLAGFFDGEGCIATSNPKKSGGVVIKISQVNHLESLLMFLEVFGGQIWEVKRRTTVGKVVFAYRGSPRFLTKIALSKMLPFLRGKKQEALIALSIFELDEKLREERKCLKRNKNRKLLFHQLRSLRGKGKVREVTA